MLPAFMVPRFVPTADIGACEFAAEALPALPNECQPDPTAPDLCAAASCVEALPELRTFAGPALLPRVPKECHWPSALAGAEFLKLRAIADDPDRPPIGGDIVLPAFMPPGPDLIPPRNAELPYERDA